MAELSHGRLLTLEQADKLGVLSAAEGLAREAPDKPWEVIMPADVPVVLDGEGADNGEPDAEPEAVMSKEKNTSLHRALHHMNKGGLHRALGVPEGEPIPQDKLDSAMTSDNAHIKHMALFAHTLKGFQK